MLGDPTSIMALADTGVVVDADYGANAAFRAGRERLGLAYGVTWARRALAAVRAGRDRRTEIRPAASRRHHAACRLGRARTPSLADRAAVSRTQGRSRARSLRGAHVPRLGASRRVDRGRVYVSADRTRSAHRRPTADIARRSRLGPRVHGPALRAAQSTAAPHARQLPPERAAPKVTK